MRVRLLAGAAALTLTLTACGDDDAETAAGAANPADAKLTLSAAASLTGALTDCAGAFSAADVRPQFAGSDELAAQARKGVVPDVFAAANTKLPQELADEGILETPVTFASNQLVLAVPADSTKIKTLDDVAADGVTLVVGAEGVPVGDYTRKVLDGLPAQQREAVLANVRSEEPDVKAVVAKLTAGAADAGFIYASDVQATDGELTAVELPEGLKPEVAYGVAVGKDAPAAATAFVEDLRSGACQKALIAAGFGPAPTG